MDLNKLIKENMLRFGTKNLTYEHLGNIISEQGTAEEPDLSKFDWSKTGTVDWNSAPIKSLVNYVRAVDSGKSYTQYEIYEAVMQWWRQHDTEDTRNSLLVWIGGEANKYYGLKAARGAETELAKASNNYTPDEIAAMATTTPTDMRLKKLGDDLLTKTNDLKGTAPEDGQAKVQLIIIAKMLIKTGEAGVSVTDPGFAALTKSVNNLQTKPEYWKPTGGYTATDVTKLKANVESYKTMLTTGTSASIIDVETTSSQVKSGMTDDIRSRLLTQLQQQVNQKIANPQSRDGIFGGRIVDISVDKAVRNADTLVVTKDSSKLSVGGAYSGAASSKVLDTIVFHFAVPELTDSQEQRNLDSQALFGDDKTELQSWSSEVIKMNAKLLKGEIRNIQQQFPDDPITVQRFEIRAFSATSCVNSGYKSGDFQGRNKVFNKFNNVVLAKDRLKSMVDAYTDALNDYLKDLEDNDGLILKKLSQGVIINAANVGPEWEYVGFGTLGDDGKVKSDRNASYINTYGPLFQEAYKKDPTLTPKKFYNPTARKTNAEIKADYETTYGNYRTATASIQIEILAPKNIVQQVAEGDYVVTTVSGYGAEITWSRRRKGNKSGRGGGRRGGMERFPPMPKFVGRTINCPNF
jgi:hypothetical protein